MLGVSFSLAVTRMHWRQSRAWIGWLYRLLVPVSTRQGGGNARPVLEYGGSFKRGLDGRDPGQRQGLKNMSLHGD